MNKTEYGYAKKAVALCKKVRPDLYPYLVAVDCMPADAQQRPAKWNTDIQLIFKAPVTGCTDDSRYAHASLEEMGRELKDAMGIDESTVGDAAYAEYDEMVAKADMTKPAYSFSPVVDGKIVGYPSEWDT